MVETEVPGAGKNCWLSHELSVIWSALFFRPGSWFTDNVIRFIIRYIWRQKLRCHKIILWHVISEFTETVFYDLKWLVTMAIVTIEKIKW